MFYYRFKLRHEEKGKLIPHIGYLWACDMQQARKHVICLSCLYMPRAIVDLVEEAEDKDNAG